MNVFVLDDDPALARSLEIILTTKGWHVFPFANPLDVCYFIEQGLCPDVLIIDQVMPEFSGTEVIDRVRRCLSRHCRVILISGHTDVIEKLDISQLGITAFLPKPIDIDRLTKLVETGTVNHNPARAT